MLFIHFIYLLLCLFIHVFIPPIQIFVHSLIHSFINQELSWFNRPFSENVYQYSKTERAKTRTPLTNSGIWLTLIRRSNVSIRALCYKWYGREGNPLLPRASRTGSPTVGTSGFFRLTCDGRLILIDTPVPANRADTGCGSRSRDPPRVSDKERWSCVGLMVGQSLRRRPPIYPAKDSLGSESPGESPAESVTCTSGHCHKTRRYSHSRRFNVGPASATLSQY